MSTKTILFVSITLLFIGLVPHSLAATNIQGFVPLAPISGLTDPSSLSVVNSSGLASFFNNLYRFAIGFAAVLAVIMIIWGGLEISTQDSVSKKSDGKQRIYNAIFGLVLVLSPVLVFSLINPNILNLSLSLPKIDLSTPMATSTPTTCPTGQTGIPPACTPILGATSGTTITGILPLCGPGVSGSGSCAVSPPACISGQWCYSTVNNSQIPSTECFTTQNGCTTLYNAQIQGGYGITVINGSSCSLCP